MNLHQKCKSNSIFLITYVFLVHYIFIVKKCKKKVFLFLKIKNKIYSTLYIFYYLFTLKKDNPHVILAAEVHPVNSAASNAVAFVWGDALPFSYPYPRTMDRNVFRTEVE